MGSRLPCRVAGCPVPPQGRRWGPAKSSCVNGFAGGPGCGAVFWICRHCDRGHRYCGERCRRKARRQQRRAANRRHQQSPEGPARSPRPATGLPGTLPPPGPRDGSTFPPDLRFGQYRNRGAFPVRKRIGKRLREARYAESAEFEPACIICGRTWGSAPVERSLLLEWALAAKR